MKSRTINRRTFLGSGTLATASMFIGGVSFKATAQDRTGTTISPAVSTTSGKVRGLVRFGVNQFYGVPYGAPTSGANRFMPPQKAPAWTGVKDSGRGCTLSRLGFAALTRPKSFHLRTKTR